MSRGLDIACDVASWLSRGRQKVVYEFYDFLPWGSSCASLLALWYECFCWPFHILPFWFSLMLAFSGPFLCLSSSGFAS